jgi:HPt (histidine-containing phosphotransfer) domain-containing protein
MDVTGLAENLGLDEETTRQLLQTFIKATAGELVKLGQAMAKGETAQVAELAHHIKGAAANLELETMRAAALKLELWAKAGSLESGETVSQTLTAELSALKTAIGPG